MSRIRTIKPDFFVSESIGELSLHARLTFIGLWTYVDDQGRAKDNPRAIRGALWPNDEETVTSADVARFIDELEQKGMVCRYTVGGANYLHVVNMRKHQAINKPSQSKLPECPTFAALAAAHSEAQERTEKVTEDSGSTPGNLPESSRSTTGGNGSGSGKGSNTSPSEAPPPLPLAPLAESVPNFEDFWKSWPRKVGRAAAQKAWTKAVSKQRANPVAIVDACRSYAERCRLTGQDPTYIPHASTWLNRGSWDDDLDAVIPLGPGMAPTAAPPMPPHCGRCDPANRWIELPDGSYDRCPDCNPDAIRSRT